MRKELKDFDWHTYGVSEDDFDYTVRLVEEIIEDRQNHLQTKIDKIKVYDFDGNLIDNSTGVADEAIDDLQYYTYVDHLFLWQFALWRLQGVFEGILKREFFPDKKMQGLKAKLNFVKDLGFTISDKDFQELIDWGQLRNALSHNPPEQYRPAGLGADDIRDYVQLVKRLTADLKKQKSKTHPNKS